MKQRNVGIDLLRIISMYMIVVLHVLGRGGVLSNVSYLSGKYITTWTLEIAMYCAVNCYAIITGYVYFGTERKWNNLLKLWFQTFFYSVGIMAVLFLLNLQPGVGLRNMVKLVFPLSANQYWYFSAYVGVFFFIPLLNCIIEFCPQRILKKRLIILIIGLTFPTVVFYGDPFVLSYGYGTLWLMILYLVGAYYKKYDVQVKNIKWYVMGYFGCVIGTSVLKYLIAYGIQIVGVEMAGSYLATNVTPTILGAAICLFKMFKTVQIKSDFWKKKIVFIGAMTYGVFLIHVHPLLAKVYLDGKFSWIAEKSIWLIIPAVLLVSIAIFILCLPIEIIRTYLFKLFKVNALSKHIVEKVKKIIERIEVYYQITMERINK